MRIFWRYWCRRYGHKWVLDYGFFLECKHCGISSINAGFMPH